MDAFWVRLTTTELVVTLWQGDWDHLTTMISDGYEHVGAGFATTDDFSCFVIMIGWVGSKAFSKNPQDPEIPQEMEYILKEMK